MAKRLNSVLGIDIGSRKIKIAEVRSQGREPVVTALGMIDTPEGAVDHTGVYNSDAVGAAIKQVLNESGATIPHAVVSIAGQASVLVRTLEVPKMNPAELKEHMQWEINRNIPFAESNVVSDYRPLETEDPASQNMDVVMAISPQSAIDTMIACVKKSGRQAAAIDVEPLALARSLQMSYGDTLTGQTICVVDVGHKTTSINIYRDGKLLMPRQVPVGGEMFTKAISDSYGVTSDEADVMKRESLQIPLAPAPVVAANPFSPGGETQEFAPYNPFSDDAAPMAPVVEPPAYEEPAGYEPVEPASFDPSQPGEVPDMTPVPGATADDRLYAAIAPVLDEFVAEIRRSIDYFRSRGGDVSQIELCGGGSRMQGLAPFLASNLDIACDYLDPLRRLNLNVRKVAPDFVEEHRQEFAVAVGNGLHIFFD